MLKFFQGLRLACVCCTFLLAGVACEEINAYICIIIEYAIAA